MHRAGEPITGALFAAMNTALGKLGASPADRSKVNSAPPEDDDDPFARFDPAREYFS
jgi:phage terminase small subunit